MHVEFKDVYTSYVVRKIISYSTHVREHKKCFPYRLETVLALNFWHSVGLLYRYGKGAAQVWSTLQSQEC